MHFPGRQWDVVAPEAEGLDSTRLQAAVEFLRANAGRDGVRELVIARNGRIVWEGDRATNVHGVWSVTKSFTSTCLGLLQDDGRCGLDTRAASLVPALTAHYADVTLRHFTTMTSGYRAVGDESRADGYSHGPSATPFEPAPEPLFAPGAAYAYWDSAMNLFALALTRAAGEPLDELFRRRIAEPIGMDPAGWRWGDFGEVSGHRVNGGSGNNNRHVFINARELARLGHLFLNHGRWNGRHLVSSNWVHAATSVQVSTTLSNAWTRSGIDGPGIYGFNWWCNGLQPDGKRPWPAVPLETFASSRLLFITQREPDDLPDTLWYLGAENGGAITATNGLIVFGLGRGPNTTAHFRGTGHAFVLGFLEGAAKDTAAHQRLATTIQRTLSDKP